MDPTYGRAKIGRPVKTYIQQLTGSGISMPAAWHDDDDVEKTLTCLYVTMGNKEVVCRENTYLPLRHNGEKEVVCGKNT